MSIMRHAMLSELAYPVFVRGAAAKVPLRKRNIIIDAVFFDNAQPTVKPV